MIRLSNLSAYSELSGWLKASRTAQDGLARLQALGVGWRRGGLPYEIVEALAAHPRASTLPPLKAMREKAAFLAGVVWTLAFVSKLSRHMEE